MTTSFNTNEPLIKRNLLRETGVGVKLISHLVAREAKLPEKPGLKMNGAGGGPEYTGHLQSVGGKEDIL